MSSSNNWCMTPEFTTSFDEIIDIFINVLISIIILISDQYLWDYHRISLTTSYSFQHDHHVYNFDKLCLHDIQQSSRMVQTSRVSILIYSIVFYSSLVLSNLVYADSLYQMWF